MRAGRDLLQTSEHLFHRGLPQVGRHAFSRLSALRTNRAASFLLRRCAQMPIVTTGTVFSSNNRKSSQMLLRTSHLTLLQQ